MPDLVLPFSSPVGLPEAPACVWCGAPWPTLLARSVEEAVVAAERRPLVAIRSFAAAPDGYGGISEIFTE